MQQFYFKFEEDTPDGRYLFSCARLRGISSNALVKRLMTAIMQDQLVEAVLDDAGVAVRRRPGEHKYRECLIPVKEG